MKILIFTIGTRGDVQPYVALGRGLKEAGHSVTICTCAEFESFIRSHGLDYAYTNNEQIEFMHSDDGRMAMENSANAWQAIRLGFKLFPKVGPMLLRQIHDAWGSIAKVAPDLILYHPKALGAKDFAEHLGVPCMLAFYLPMYVPTGDFPAMGLPDLGSRAWNRLTYRLINRVTWWASGKNINRWRNSVGMKPRRAGKYLETTSGQTVAALHAYSEAVIPRPSDWPDSAAVTGYWFLDRLEAWEPDERLAAFLAGGETPVYIGFGSIFGRDPARLARTVVDAVQAAGVRAILASGWGGLDAGGLTLPDTILKVDAVPHDWLFPRVSAVVHHGGCGTTAAGLRAGNPTIICPFFGDQPFWGKTVHAIGVGTRPIPQKELTVERLSTAIREATTDETMCKKAEQLGRHLRSEDGVTKAVHFIERWMDRCN